MNSLFLVTKSENDLSPSISPASDCFDLIFGNNILGCVPFLSDGSEKTKPEVSCCSGFEIVLNTNAECICEAIISNAQMGIYLNVNKTGSNTKGYKKIKSKGKHAQTMQSVF